MRALNKKLLRDLWRAKSQALAIAAVLACGVAIIIMTYGAMMSLRQTRDTYYERNRFGAIFSQLKRAPLPLAANAARIPGVSAADARITHYAALDIAGLARPAAAYLVSLPEARAPSLNKITLRSGRLPERDRDELVMSENMALALGYAPGSKIGVILAGRKRLFTVTGVALSPEFVYVLAPGQLMPDDQAFGILWLDRSLMEAAFDMHGAFNDISLSVLPNASIPDVIRRLDNLLAPYGGSAAYGRDDQSSHAYITQELDQLRTIAMVIPPVFLGVAAFLIHMVLSRLIETERESIGLLKSFGYSNNEVGWHYVKFSLAIALLGAAAGCAAGFGLGRWMTGMYQNYFRFPFLEYRMDNAVFAAAIAIAFAAAMAGTLSAVGRAIRLVPAEAMRPPSPPAYRRTLVDLMGLEGRISVPTQMIIRHIGRWPLRAFFTASGVALAIMLLVGLFFFFDAIDELVDSYYYRANRQDIVISLIEQRSEKAGFEVDRLPGIRGAEPVLEVAARLSHGHLVQRLGIVGLPNDTRFRAFVDSAGRSFTLPQEGVLISAKLASLLDLRVGQKLEIQLLEGTRQTKSVPVSGIVSENVGLSAYMDRRALGTLAGENGSLTSIQAAVDSAAQAALLGRLKQMPAVATVSTRAQAISSLRDNMARSMVIVIYFYIGLGSIIVFGVVYNAARISLSERGRELASLRVMGFTRSETGYVLIGELALLVVAALPAGCALGYGLAWLMSHAMETKLFRVPFVIAPATFGIAMSIALASAALSALAVAQRINRLDMISVLKTRE
ncbi:MAG TPA: FtsX-like permease family protein [Rhizomicrobium sp.]|nr:FtsX-like permease family protein [Rhizomicrobium sp.]